MALELQAISIFVRCDLSLSLPGMFVMNSWYVYLLRCSDGSLYCGLTKDLDRRVGEHNDGIGCRYTRPRRPVQLVWSADSLTKSEAYKEEFRIKRLSKSAKEVLVDGGLGQGAVAP